MFKTRIKADADIEIERVKNSLQIVAIEHQVRFAKLHEKRAQVIADLYKQLVDLHRHGAFFVETRENNPDPAKERGFREIQREMADLSQFFEQHQIYLPISVCASLEKLLGEIRGNVSAVTKRTSCLDGSRQNGDCWVSPIALNTKPKTNPQHGPTVENASDFIAISFSTWIATRKQRGWLDANDHGEVWN